MKILMKLIAALAFLAAAAYGVIRFIDRIYENLGTHYAEFSYDYDDGEYRLRIGF